MFARRGRAVCDLISDFAHKTKEAMQELFPPLPPGMRRAFAEVQPLIDELSPLRAAHRRDLPLAVRELSARLTSERGKGDLPYWSSPRLASAYLRWFLPWNLLRLGRLLNGIAPFLPAPDAAQRPALLDLGSGPLTLPLALWSARPDWRDLPLECLCLDASPRALELGRALFARLAGADSPWRIVPLRASLEAAGRPSFFGKDRRFHLISVANALNEMKQEKHAPSGLRSDGVVERLSRLTTPGGHVLCVEPGTRLGGKLVLNAREQALRAGLHPVLPCPHAKACPLRGTRSWCHFTFDAQGAPEELVRLAREAKLPKTALSLAFVLLRSGGLFRGEDKTGRPAARVLSAPFNVPGLCRAARYACSARGLLLLTGAEKAPSGALIPVELPAHGRKDARSGALII